jgi:branched-chain amino acid transport system ATP-binding protein
MLLQISGMQAGYGAKTVISDVSFALEPGQILAFLGHNGAGKTTTLKALMGLLPLRAGSVAFDGKPIDRLDVSARVALGLRLLPEGRGIFHDLSVTENIDVVAARNAGAQAMFGTADVYRLFPMLRERRHAPSTALSGGQQQMVAIGRSLMSNPRILLCDELSLGLAPIVIRDIYAALADIKTRGTSVVLVEQDLAHAMSVADRAYCFQEGRVSLAGRPQDLTRDAIHAAYFGL